MLIRVIVKNEQSVSYGNIANYESSIVGTSYVDLNIANNRLTILELKT
jgi:hypothetical protein